jgi:hypothetical protein
MACSLTFVSCSKDKDDEGGEGGGNTQTASAKVTFGSNSWDATYGLMYTGYASEHSLIEGRLFQTQGQLPYVDFMTTINPGNYSAQITTTNLDQNGNDVGYTYSQGTNSMDIYNVEYANQTQVQGSSSVHGDWGLISATLKVTAADMNALTYSAELNAVMYDYYSWFNELVNNVEDADTENLTVKINNFSFTNWQ